MEGRTLSIDVVLDRLDGVKRIGRDKWIAKCPAHNDKSPSLSLRLTPDGNVLLHDFGGCEPRDVLKAVGLTISELFPAKLESGRTDKRANVRELRIAQWAAALRVLAHESSVLQLAATATKRRQRMSKLDEARFILACRRIDEARSTLTHDWRALEYDDDLRMMRR